MKQHDQQQLQAAVNGIAACLREATGSHGGGAYGK